MKKVIIIDDEEDIIDLLTYHLDKNNFSVLVVSDAQSAMRLVQIEQPDAIIVNYLPQFGNKVHLCKDLNKVIDPLKTSIICLESESCAHSELKDHADICINIPVNPEILVSQLNQTLEQKRLSSPQELP